MKKSSLFLVITFFSMFLFGYAKANFFTDIHNAIKTNPGKLVASYIALQAGLTMFATGSDFLDKLKQANEILFKAREKGVKSGASIRFCTINYLLIATTTYSVYHNFIKK